MKASDYIISFLKKEGVGHIFGYIGGMITHLVDSIDKAEGIEYIQTYHEQTSAIAAEGYSRETNNIGVAISTSGPGLTNMITGIADAYFDSIPVIYISGQVNTYEYKYDKPIRQQGFQEMDVVTLCKSITKYSKLVDDISQLRYELEKAVHIAKSGRQGPILLDIPMNIQRMEVDPNSLKGYTASKEELIPYSFKEINKAIRNSKRPLLLIGGGLRYDREGLEEFINKYNIPIVSSLLGKGIIDENRENYLGMIGSYGVRAANIAMSQADLIIALGSRLDSRQTGANFEYFRDKLIIQVDIDNNELENHRLENRIKVNDYSSQFLSRLMEESPSLRPMDGWIYYINYLNKNYSQTKEIEKFVENKMPYRAMEVLNDYSKPNDVFTVDIGQNQMWAAQTLRITQGQSFYTSGGHAPMGYAMPSAIGHSIANPQKRVFAIVGDGGFLMSEQSLYIISQYNLNILVILLNNSSLGMITHFQDLYFDSNHAGTTKDTGYQVRDPKLISESHGLNHYLIEEKDLNNTSYLNDIFSKHNGVIEFRIQGPTIVSPKLEYDQPIYNPSPFLSKDELDKLLKR